MLCVSFPHLSIVLFKEGGGGGGGGRILTPAWVRAAAGGGGANKAASCPPKPPPRLIMHPVSLPGILNPDVGPRETCSRQRPAGTTAIHEGPMPQANRPNVDLLLDQRRKVKS